MSDTVTGEIVARYEYDYVMGVCMYDEFAISEPGEYVVVRVENE